MKLRILPLILIALLAAPNAPGRKSPTLCKCRPGVVARNDLAAISLKYRQQVFQVISVLSHTSILPETSWFAPVVVQTIQAPVALPPPTESDPCYGFMSLQL
jgi:hypothetical protein